MGHEYGSIDEQYLYFACFIVFMHDRVELK
jgi:hypothetical protein